MQTDAFGFYDHEETLRVKGTRFKSNLETARTIDAKLPDQIAEFSIWVEWFYFDVVFGRRALLLAGNN